jgi:hypothetical protein
MKLFRRLWSDEAGVLVSAEAVVVGTVGIIGLTAGLSAVSTAVNEELKDMAFAIRSLDQSYSVPGMKGCGAWTAGSCYQQEPVKESLKELNTVVDKAERQEKQQADRLRQQLERQERVRRQKMEAEERRDDERDEKQSPKRFRSEQKKKKSKQSDRKPQTVT